MHRIITIALMLAIVLLSIQPAFADMSMDERLADAETIIDLYEHRYAPAPLKKHFRDIDMEQLATQLREQAKNAADDKSFYAAVAHYLAGLQDAHVEMYAPTTHVSYLGFKTTDIAGRIIISHIHTHLLGRDDFPFKIGDEVIAIDGVDVNTVRDELLALTSTGSERADARFSASLLTQRPEALLFDAPQGSARVIIRPQDSTDEITIETPWFTQGMPLAPTLSSAKTMKRFTSSSVRVRGPLEQLRDMSLKSLRFEDEWLPEAPHFPLWDSFERIENAPLFAGAATIGSKRIAFIRIASFDPDYPSSTAVLQFLERQIPLFQEQTDAMIIDTTGNPGGELCYGEDVASFFIDKAIPSVVGQVKPTRLWSTELEEALEWMPDEGDRAIVKGMIATVREALATGDDLTDPIPLCRLRGTIEPAKKTYTKPILMLVDEMNASMGDIFPAILQDAGRATVFGAQTMGAGGNVVDVGPLGNSDISVRITQSLVLRSKATTTPEGIRTRYVENVGVIPDVPYEVTLDDYLNGYKGYREAVEQGLQQITP